MASKNSTEQAQATPESETVNVRLDLPVKVRNELRVVAAKHGKSMASYVRDLVIEHVEQEKKSS